VKQDANYDEIQKALIDFIPEEGRDRTAGLLWLLAKHTCKAHSLKCDECLLNPHCFYERES